MESVTAKKTNHDRVKSFLLKVKALAYSLLHLKDHIQVVKLRSQHEGIQLKPAELIKIFQAIRKFKDCNMLVFGLGNDSPFWCSANGKGRTVFLEDFKPWYEKITAKYPDIEAYPVSYPCNITQWKEVLDQPEQLAMDLPVEITGHQWDVILVDGPRGHKYSSEIPGRMSSIFTASRLVGKKGNVFVHDAQRTVENAYAQHYLGKHFIEKVHGRALLLIYSL
jgi:uncharacterized protein (TIGR01627 family)